MNIHIVFNKITGEVTTVRGKSEDDLTILQRLGIPSRIYDPEDSGIGEGFLLTDEMFVSDETIVGIFGRKSIIVDIDTKELRSA